MSRFPAVTGKSTSLVAIAALLLALAASGCSRPASRPNVLLITIDTLRADRLGSYGYRLETSPNIDRLAARGVRFTECMVQWPKTWPSIASFMTGAYPKTTGLRVESFVVPEALTVMSELFGKAGYRTGAVVSNINIGKAFGFDQGFDFFVESWQERWQQEAPGQEFVVYPGNVKRFTDATLVTDQGLGWLQSLPAGEPWFLWLHYMEPHGPYVPPEAYADLFEGQHRREFLPLEAVLRYQWQFDEATGRPIRDLGFYKAQYDREIRYLDDELGKLFRAVPRDTLIVFTADHGESLGEHRYYLEHGLLPYQPTAHVPAIVVMEGRVPAGRTIEEPIGVIDLARTMVELAGLETPDAFEGSSLLRLIDGRSDAAPEHVFMESGYDVERPQLTVRRGRWKLIEVTSPQDLPRMTGADVELYDLQTDPGELKNRAAEFPRIVEELRETLLRWYASGPRPETPGSKVDLEALDEDSKAMLRALGYLE